MIRALTIVLACAVAGLTASVPTHGQASTIKSGHIAANGVNYYYEIRGSGEPLLLLHGGLGSIDMFGPLLPKFTAHRQVIGVDLPGTLRSRIGWPQSRPWRTALHRSLKRLRRSCV